MAQNQIKEYPHCCGCGASNPIGLRLQLQLVDGTLTTEFTPREEHQGWPGIVHGGVIAAVLYEVLENLPYYRGDITMMESMETRFRRPAKTGEKVFAKSWLDDQSGRNMSVSATLTGEEGGLIAEGSAILVVLTQSQKVGLGLA